MNLWTYEPMKPMNFACKAAGFLMIFSSNSMNLWTYEPMSLWTYEPMNPRTYETFEPRNLWTYASMKLLNCTPKTLLFFNILPITPSNLPLTKPYKLFTTEPLQL